MRRFFFLVVVLFSFFFSALGYAKDDCLAYSDDKVPNSVKKAISSFVTIFAFSRSGKIRIGSGVIIDKNGYILTAGHLFWNNNGEEWVDIFVLRYNCEEYKANLVDFQTSPDIGVLKIDAGYYLPTVALGDYLDINNLKRFNFVYLISAPHGTPNVITRGVLLSFDGYYMRGIVPAQPGSSGGALFNDSGKMIGMIIGCEQLKSKKYSYIKGSGFSFCAGESLSLIHI